MENDVDLSTLTLRDNREEGRFELAFADTRADLEYMKVGDTLILTHTEVPVGYEGHGVGGHLVRLVLEYARAQGFRVRTVCPFVSEWLARHPEEFSDVLVKVGGR
jgi:predicted GNAT family acetyltransferase